MGEGAALAMEMSDITLMGIVVFPSWCTLFRWELALL
jgi:hypothetical protein